MSRSRRRRLLAVPGALALAGVSALLPTGGVAAARHGSVQCLDGTPLASKATWTTHRLAPHVRLAEAQVQDDQGTVDMHVLRVDVTSPSVSFRPLMEKVANRSPLSGLAADRPKLVAATNTGFFDFRYGVPTAPVVNKRAGVTISNDHQRVVGFDPNGRLQSGNVWLKGSVTANGTTKDVKGVNALTSPDGISLYNTRWGWDHRVPMHWNSVSRYVVNGKVTSGTDEQHDVIHKGATLVVAHGGRAIDWLNALHVGDKISTSLVVRTHAPRPFVQAYGAGLQLIQRKGVARTDLSCRWPTPDPARTAIGWADGGRSLIIAVVADHPGTSMHGLNSKQMSSLMVELGAGRAFAFDGSGSSEMLARMRSTGRLTLRNYTADGAEREMPVGLGVFSSRL